MPSSASEATASSIGLTNAAFVKLLLHAFKYPAAPVFGILLGKSTSSSAKLKIEDIVPLFHTPPAAPLAEAAFAVVEDFATTQQLELVGCYYASDCTHESEPSAFAKKALAKLSSFNPAAVLLQVNNNSLEQFAEAKSLQTGVLATFTAMDKTRITRGADLCAPSAEAVALLADSLQRDVHELLRDFDEYVDGGLRGNEETDWVGNQQVNDALAKVGAKVGGASRSKKD